jgi:peptidoglycan/LPS O-acetylase OafA/YrhL
LLAAIIKRPFRLGGMVVFSEVVAVILLLSGGFFNVPACIQTFSIPEFSRFWPHELLNFRKILRDLTTRMFQAGSDYNTPLWSIYIELYGSLLTFGFLLLFRNSRLRALGYLLAAIYFHPSLYIGFIIGIGFADLAKNFPNVLDRLRGSFIVWPLLLVGLFVGSFPHQAEQWSSLEGTIYEHLRRWTFLGGVPSMPGAALVFGAIFLSPAMQSVLSHSIFAFVGRISYSVYAIHFLLLGSFSCWMFLFLHGRLSYNENCAFTGLVSVLILIPLSLLLTKFVDEPATRAANRIGQFWLSSRARSGPSG